MHSLGVVNGHNDPGECIHSTGKRIHRPQTMEEVTPMNAFIRREIAFTEVDECPHTGRLRVKEISMNGPCRVGDWAIPPRMGGKPRASKGHNKLNDPANPAQGVHETAG
jgi:hypothetical protein